MYRVDYRRAAQLRSDRELFSRLESMAEPELDVPNDNALTTAALRFDNTLH